MGANRACGSFLHFPVTRNWRHLSIGRILPERVGAAFALESGSRGFSNAAPGRAVSQRGEFEFFADETLAFWLLAGFVAMVVEHEL